MLGPALLPEVRSLSYLYRMETEGGMHEHYKPGKETARLDGPSLERLRTESILRRFLPKAPATILDIGGAAGVYAFPLAAHGYEVHLVDPVDLHIQQAREINKTAASSLKNIALGDARELSFKDEFADAILYLGPLYHLTHENERKLAIQEALRVLKPGGVIIAAFISRFTSLIDGVRGGYLKDPEFGRIVDQDLSTSRHTNPSGNPAYFTDAVFHHPDAAKSEIQAGGFKNVQCLSIEGPIWMVSSIREQLSDPKLCTQILGFLERIEGDQTLLGASGHFAVIAKK